MSLPRMLLAAALTLLPTASLADGISVYQVQGVVQGETLLGGTVTLDLTMGTVSASSLQIYTPGSTSLSFNYGSVYPTGYDPPRPAEYLVLYSYNPQAMPVTNYSILYLALQTLPSDGQSVQICTISMPCLPGAPDSSVFSFTGNFGQYNRITYLSSAQFTPVEAAASAPEPSSLLLLGTGLMAMGGVFRRRLVC